MRIAALLFLLGSLASGTALADACHMLTCSSSAEVPEVETESCYEFQGMPADAIGWSCSNESKDMLNSQKQQVERCKAGSRGRCVAALPQESLANPRSTGENRPIARPSVPNDAKVITHYYSVANLGQARSDCENGGGTWQDR